MMFRSCERTWMFSCDWLQHVLDVSCRSLCHRCHRAIEDVCRRRVHASSLLFLIANIVTTSKALVTSSDALVSTSFLLLLVRHLLLVAWHLFLVASLFLGRPVRSKVRSMNGCRVADHILSLVPDAERRLRDRWTFSSISDVCFFFRMVFVCFYSLSLDFDE